MIRNGESFKRSKTMKEFKKAVWIFQILLALTFLSMGSLLTMFFFNINEYITITCVLVVILSNVTHYYSKKSKRIIDELENNKND